VGVFDVEIGQEELKGKKDEEKMRGRRMVANRTIWARQRELVNEWTSVHHRRKASLDS
jgi:hypothetical protein